MPGSHHPEQHARLAACQRRQPPVRTGAEAAAYQASIPGYTADTAPGDVIVFDLHTWHASFGGRDRLAWTAVYQRCPETSEERNLTLRSVHDGFEQAFPGFDRDRYPLWRDWLGGAAAHPGRVPVIERMRDAGVLDLPRRAGRLVTVSPPSAMRPCVPGHPEFSHSDTAACRRSYGRRPSGPG